MDTANSIMNLRKKTGCRYIDCKAALTEANGTEEKAEEILHKRGLVEADCIASINKFYKELDNQHYYNDKLDSMIKSIENDCKHFGVNITLDNVLVKQSINFNGNDYCFCYIESDGYVLGSWERGKCCWSINSLDELGFRFLFMWDVIFKGFNPITQEQIEKAEKFMSAAFALFGNTQEYHKAQEDIRNRKILKKQ